MFEHSCGRYHCHGISSAVMCLEINSRIVTLIQLCPLEAGISALSEDASQGVLDITVLDINLK